MKYRQGFWFLVLVSSLTSWASAFGQNSSQTSLNNQEIDGFKGIWFTLGQYFDYGDKYSGGLGTYTAKHKPLAIYAPTVNKTFFVYGGTTHPKQNHLLCMIASYDHDRQMVSKPVVVYDKKGVDDPHDNPSLLIDPEGYLWVFVSGRGTRRPGFKYRSTKPYDCSEFEQISEEEMTYPQPWYIKDKGFFHFFTKYSGVRELYFETSRDGRNWTSDQKLAGIVGKPGEKSGHYQLSQHYNDKVATFFSRHPNGNVDRRTNLYYVQSTDFGKSWETIDGHKLSLPITEVHSKALVHDYGAEKKNVYLKDIAFDGQGNPVVLYLTSGGHEPGPGNDPREWRISHWQNSHWETTVITRSDHNYDMGSIWINDQQWTVVAPINEGPQVFGGGGEIEIWTSTDAGSSWSKKQSLTNNSKYNHNYVRKVMHGKGAFRYFWADGNPNKRSKSRLYFGDLEGNGWQLPYKMRKAWATPKKYKRSK